MRTNWLNNMRTLIIGLTHHSYIAMGEFNGNFAPKKQASPVYHHHLARPRGKCRHRLSVNSRVHATLLRTPVGTGALQRTTCYSYLGVFSVDSRMGVYWTQDRGTIYFLLCQQNAHLLPGGRLRTEASVGEVQPIMRVEMNLRGSTNN